jgi:hypothetical protein
MMVYTVDTALENAKVAFNRVCADKDITFLRLGEVGEGGGFGFEGWDGFDEAGDGEGIADAARAADEAKDAAFAGELDGDANERGNAGAVDLGDAVEDDYYFAGTMVDYGLERFVELLAGFTNGEAATDVENGDGSAGANVYFHGSVIGHRDDSPSGG